MYFTYFKSIYGYFLYKILGKDEFEFHMKIQRQKIYLTQKNKESV